NNTACATDNLFCKVLHSKNLTIFDPHLPCEVIRRMSTEKCSMIIDNSEFWYMVKTNMCKFAPTSYTKLQYIRMNMGNGFQTWILQKSVPYADQFSL
ncbi:unnamed protein product, partial [Callosobruchus maculatus]